MAELKQDTLDRLTAFIAQSYADIETGPGSVISELLLKLAAEIQNQQYNQIDALSQSKAISSVLASTSDTMSLAMDLIASNYNVSRSAGLKVKGKIKVTVSEPNEYVFRAGLVFVQPALNLSYSLISDTRISPTPSALFSEIQLYENQGMYYFLLDVEADYAGAEYQVPSGTVFSLGDVNFINDFVGASAYGNFSSGSAPETDKQLVSKIKYSLGSSRFESSVGIANRLRADFPSFQSLSVCGANDPELTRSKQNTLGLSTFGKADVYVRTSVGPAITHITKKAKKGSNNTWSLNLEGADIPGFYRIISIIPASTVLNLTGSLVFSIVYGRTTYPGERNNELFSVADARFTKYQTAALTFTYDGYPAVAEGEYADFILEAAYQPNILEIQDLLLSDAERLACADYLVKAVTPCMVSLNINLVKKKPTDDAASLGLTQLKKDIFNYINTIPFGGELYASTIIDLCHNYDIKRVDLPIKMSGVILYVNDDGTSGARYLDDSDVLTIPTELSKGISPKTTAYFIDYYDATDPNSSVIDNIGLSIV
jgi:hypothetical protein